MPVIVIFAEDNFTLRADNRIAELIGITPMLKNRSGNPEIAHTAGDCVAAEEVRNFGSAESKKPAIRNHCHRSDWGQMRSAKRAETVVFVERE